MGLFCTSKISDGHDPMKRPLSSYLEVIKEWQIGQTPLALLVDGRRHACERVLSTPFSHRKARTEPAHPFLCPSRGLSEPSIASTEVAVVLNVAFHKHD